MTAEEFIQSKVINDNGYEHHSCEMVAKADAIRAIEMAHREINCTQCVKLCINNVWHKPNNGEPSLYLMLIELNNGEFELDYTYDSANTKRWAYVKDLIGQ
jgi:hypothetical protein